eukprot:SAG31_NODE_335_length_17509_cov_7.127972_2_plen_238_part_00
MPATTRRFEPRKVGKRDSGYCASGSAGSRTARPAGDSAMDIGAAMKIARKVGHVQKGHRNCLHIVKLSRLVPYFSRLKCRISRIVAQKRESNSPYLARRKSVAGTTERHHAVCRVLRRTDAHTYIIYRYFDDEIFCQLYRPQDRRIGRAGRISRPAVSPGVAGGCGYAPHLAAARTRRSAARRPAASGCCQCCRTGQPWRLRTAQDRLPPLPTRLGSRPSAARACREPRCPRCSERF